ncbi:MAG: hypothetical protein U1F83_16985 [Verrucomicrobiota bacterium]
MVICQPAVLFPSIGNNGIRAGGETMAKYLPAVTSIGETNTSGGF